MAHYTDRINRLKGILQTMDLVGKRVTDLNKDKDP
jgi:hypothetical protein